MAILEKLKIYYVVDDVFFGFWQFFIYEFWPFFGLFGGRGPWDPTFWTRVILVFHFLGVKKGQKVGKKWSKSGQKVVKKWVFGPLFGPLFSRKCLSR